MGSLLLYGGTFARSDSQVRKKGVFWKRGLFRKVYFLEILENLEILEILGNPQTVEHKEESDHFLEILENLEILEILGSRECRLPEPSPRIASTPQAAAPAMKLLTWLLCHLALCFCRRGEAKQQEFKTARGQKHATHSGARWCGRRRLSIRRRRSNVPATIEEEEELPMRHPGAWEEKAAWQQWQSQVGRDEAGHMENQKREQLLMHETLPLLFCLRHWRRRATKGRQSSAATEEPLQDSDTPPLSRVSGNAVKGKEVEITKVAADWLAGCRTKRVSTDGNCFWRAAAKCLQCSWRKLKESTVAHAEQLGDDEWSKRHSRRGCWIDTKGVKYFAEAHALAVYVNTGQHTTWCVRGGDAGAVHLRLRNCHYAACMVDEKVATSEAQRADDGEEQTIALEGGAPKVRPRWRSRTPPRVPDLDLSPAGAWTVDVQLQNRDDVDEELSVRLREGTEVSRLAQIAADRLGTVARNILIYRDVSNEIVGHTEEVRQDKVYQYCEAEPLTAEQLRRAEAEEARAQQRREAVAAEEEVQEEHGESGSEATEEEAEIPWDTVSLVPLATFSCNFLIFSPFEGWQPYVLRTDNRASWANERTFCANLLGVRADELLWHEADPATADRYGCPRGLIFVFPAPTRADLTGGAARKSSRQSSRKGQLQTIDFDLTKKEGRTLEVILQNRDDTAQALTIRFSEGARASKLKRLAADKEGVDVEEIVLYRGATNDIIKDVVLLRDKCTYEYLSQELASSDTEQVEVEDVKFLRTAQEQREEDSSEMSEEPTTIPWETVSVSALATAASHFLILVPYKGWQPFILRTDDPTSWVKEKAFCAGILGVSQERIMLQIAGVDLAATYQCEGVLIFAFAAPSFDALAGGGKQSAKKKHHKTGKDMERRSRRKADREEAQDKEVQHRCKSPDQYRHGEASHQSADQGTGGTHVPSC